MNPTKPSAAALRTSFVLMNSFPFWPKSQFEVIASTGSQEIRHPNCFGGLSTGLAAIVLAETLSAPLALTSTLTSQPLTAVDRGHHSMGNARALPTETSRLKPRLHCQESPPSGFG